MRSEPAPSQRTHGNIYPNAVRGIHYRSDQLIANQCHYSTHIEGLGESSSVRIGLGDEDLPGTESIRDQSR